MIWHGSFHCVRNTHMILSCDGGVGGKNNHLGALRSTLCMDDATEKD